MHHAHDERALLPKASVLPRESHVEEATEVAWQAHRSRVDPLGGGRLLRVTEAIVVGWK